MNIWQLFIMSAVEGVTEFLPISSTGHLILTAKILNLPQTDFLKTFEIAIQLGAILSVLVIYIKLLLKNLSLIKKLFIAFLPTAVIGLLFYKLIKNVFLESTLITTISLFIGGVVIIFLEKFIKKTSVKTNSFDQITYKQSFMIGVFQSVSVIPGVSRAAATIIGGLLEGIDRKTATEFSFLLAIPTMFAATALDIFKSYKLIATGDLFQLIIAMFLSFIFAFVAVRFLVDFVKKNDFTFFGYYRIIVAVLFWLLIR